MVNMPAILKDLVAVAAGALGVLFGIGFLLSALFEIQGFGDRDSSPSGWRLVEYAAGFTACVLVPVALCRILRPGRGPAWVFALAVVTVGVLAILGLSVVSAGG